MKFRLWLATNLPTITTIAILVGGAGPYVPELLSVGVSPHWVHVLGVLVAGIGALGAKLENPPLWVKTGVPWLYPVTPAMHDAALARLVSIEEVKAPPPIVRPE
jgi:hypothetical protein